MTALCGGGASQARPGFAIVQYVGPAALGAMLNNIPTPWAVAFAAYVGLITYDLASFCTTDPPSDPGLTGRDFTDLVNVTNPFSFAAKTKIQQWIGHNLWWNFCQCSAVPTPPAPAPLAPPSGLPSQPAPVRRNRYSPTVRFMGGT